MLLGQNDSIAPDSSCQKHDSSYFEKIWLEIASLSNDFELSLDPTLRRNTGSYYTGLLLAKRMVDELFETFDKRFIETLNQKTFLEPCVGTGNFVFAFLRKIYELDLPLSSVGQVLNNIYVCDTNQEALNLYEILLKKFVSAFWGIQLNSEYFSSHVGGGLLYDVTKKDLTYIPIKKVFPSAVVKNGFDIIITNPPYKNLKAEKNKFICPNDYEQTKNQYSLIAKDVKHRFCYSNDGVLNLYKLFVEKIFLEYSKENAFISLLIPSTVLSDKTCEKLRSFILANHKLYHVSIIRENNPFINAQQSLCTLLVEKNKSTSSITIFPDICKNPDQSSKLLIDDILNVNTGNAIFSLPSKEYDVLKKMRSFPTVKDLPFIINMRGELDLTANSNSIVQTETKFPLLRGKNIGYFCLSCPPENYVEASFVDKSNKNIFVKKPRIICQQVVNIHKERRVSFAYIDSDYVLGNSCNFIAVEANDSEIDLFVLLGLFNSPIINWLFKLTSTNNHINNYEIDSFPIPINSPFLKSVGLLTRKYLESPSDELLEEIYSLSYACYGVSNPTSISKPVAGNIEDSEFYLALKKFLPFLLHDQAQLLLNDGISLDTVINEAGLLIDKTTKQICEHILNKFQKMSRGEVLNHLTFKLSDLDLEMVRAVPQGGNWKSIPPETIDKSQRLLQISKSGGRTTLYGRLAYKKPSYTITTYFNRPGNGTYIHPIYDRVISVREAARLQSFKDNYFFYGNKTQLLKQVGNAVPPLLAYQIGKSVISKTGCKTSIDLFCGAGGMTAGFKEAGMNSILGVDFDRSACITFKANNPEIDMLCDDITKQDVKQKIVDAAFANNVDIICGGPPCQGFSHAGKRFVDDPRNELFKHFIDVVRVVRPRVVIMENVEGMLTFLKGEIYRQIIDLFSSLGYNAKGKLLYAHKYGVPQKRKRVIIICVDKSFEFEPAELFPNETTPSDSETITVWDAIGDLEKIPCSETAKYCNDSTRHAFVDEMMGYRPFGEFLENKDLMPVCAKPIKSSVKQLSLF